MQVSLACTSTAKRGENIEAQSQTPPPSAPNVRTISGPGTKKNGISASGRGNRTHSIIFVPLLWLTPAPPPPCVALRLVFKV